MREILKINNITKIYKNQFKALDELNLNINEGEIFALLGPNGAGKSTLINTVCGILNFDKGDIKVNEFDIIKDYRKARSLIGIVPQELNLEAFENVWDNVNYSRGLYGKSPNHEYIEKLLKELSLWDKKDSKLRELSGGMKRRVLIAKALSHEPKLLFLDEPTASLDPIISEYLRNFILDYKENNEISILFSSHNMQEVQGLCDQIIFLKDGKIVEKGNIEEMYSYGDPLVPWINSPMPNRKTDTNNQKGFSTDFIGQNWDYPEANYQERQKS